MVKVQKFVPLTSQHVYVCTVRNSKNVRWDFITPFTTVEFGATICVYRETFVRVDSDAEKPGVSLKNKQS